MEPAAAILDYPAAPPRHRGGRAWFVIGRLTLIAALIGVAVVAYIEGQKLRRWTWDYTQPIHFFYDINNGYYWGSRAWESPDPRKPDAPGPGFLNVYDVVASQAQESADRWEAEQKRRAVQRGRATNEIEVEPDYRLDYAPLRLLLISKWVQWGRETYPDKNQWKWARLAAQNGSNPSYWETPYAFFKPMLDFNTAMELVAVAGLFLLTRHWAVRWRRGTAKAEIPPGRGWPWFRLVDWFNSPDPFRGWFAGAVAGLLFWFNPAIVLSAHGWPTWDMWVIPFFVWALYLACIDWWFVSGLVIAAAAMFKGQ